MILKLTSDKTRSERLREINQRGVAPSGSSRDSKSRKYLDRNREMPRNLPSQCKYGRLLQSYANDADNLIGMYDREGSHELVNESDPERTYSKDGKIFVVHMVTRGPDEGRIVVDRCLSYSKIRPSIMPEGRYIHDRSSAITECTKTLLKRVDNPIRL